MVMLTQDIVNLNKSPLSRKTRIHGLRPQRPTVRECGAGPQAAQGERVCGTGPQAAHGKRVWCWTTGFSSNSDDFLGVFELHSKYHLNREESQPNCFFSRSHWTQIALKSSVIQYVDWQSTSISLQGERFQNQRKQAARQGSNNSLLPDLPADYNYNISFLIELPMDANITASPSINLRREPWFGAIAGQRLFVYVRVTLLSSAVRYRSLPDLPQWPAFTAFRPCPGADTDLTMARMCPEVADHRSGYADTRSQVNQSDWPAGS
ncbi:hypothetical protein RRG08_061361 [Elysia crispata]|uniref:Uncharacterized protein n=1 Tax=Elysia crispata TaxID=231223 RepID=A0AAE1DYB6_9GAST|nr:hypothetical protein RRG08_061361 [Elysia crispata]